MNLSSTGAQLSSPTDQLAGSSKHAVAVLCYRTEITVSSETEASLQLILVSGFCFAVYFRLSNSPLLETKIEIDLHRPVPRSEQLI